MKRPLVVLLTATIDPGMMGYLQIRDPMVRLRAYEQALRFYLSGPPGPPLIFCENSGYDLTSIKTIAAKDNPQSRQIEILSFAGNDYPPGLGKGYGEIGILAHVLANSRCLPANALVLKITGRLKVRNVASLVDGLDQRPEIELFCDLRGNLSWADSRVFAATVGFLGSHLLSLRDAVDDSRGVTFEHVLARAAHLALARGSLWSMLPTTPEIQGVSATSLERYPNSWIARIRRETFRRLKVAILGR
jgi:hypothetical protein